MEARALRELLEKVQRGEASVDEATAALARLPFADLGYARIDHHRSLRQGFPEVVLGEAKTAQQIAGIMTEIARGGGDVLATRIDATKAAQVVALCPAAVARPEARAVVIQQTAWRDRGRGVIAIVCAGTSDLPVVEEAALTAHLLGNRVERISDVGVAGIHRLLAVRDRLTAASVVIVVAGMEGALASAVAGMVARPVIAVPTSVGYGASFGGLAALLAMLSSCAAGVTVVNIDNGFGAGYAAAVINRIEGA